MVLLVAKRLSLRRQPYLFYSSRGSRWSSDDGNTIPYSLAFASKHLMFQAQQQEKEKWGLS
jgi:hypothetical protein